MFSASLLVLASGTAAAASSICGNLEAEHCDSLMINLCLDHGSAPACAYVKRESGGLLGGILEANGVRAASVTQPPICQAGAMSQATCDDLMMQLCWEFNDAAACAYLDARGIWPPPDYYEPHDPGL